MFKTLCKIKSGSDMVPALRKHITENYRKITLSNRRENIYLRIRLIIHYKYVAKETISEFVFYNCIIELQKYLKI